MHECSFELINARISSWPNFCSILTVFQDFGKHVWKIAVECFALFFHLLVDVLVSSTFGSSFRLGAVGKPWMLRTLIPRR